MITFQLDGGGPTPYTDTLDIDNLVLTDGFGTGHVRAGRIGRRGIAGFPPQSVNSR